MKNLGINFFSEYLKNKFLNFPKFLKKTLSKKIIS